MNFIDLTSDEKITALQIFTDSFFQHTKTLGKEGIWTKTHRIIKTRKTASLSQIQISFFQNNTKANFVFYLHFVSLGKNVLPLQIFLQKIQLTHHQRIKISNIELINDHQYSSANPQTLTIRIKGRFILQEKTEPLIYVDCYQNQICQMINSLNRSQSFINLGLNLYYSNKVYEISWGCGYRFTDDNKSIKKLVKQIFAKLQVIYSIKAKVSLWFHKHIQINKKSQIYAQKQKELQKMKKQSNIQSNIITIVSDFRITQKQGKDKKNIQHKSKSSNIIKSVNNIKQQIQKERHQTPNFNPNTLLICRGIRILQKTQDIQIKKSCNSLLRMVRLQHQIIDTIIRNRQRVQTQGNINGIIGRTTTKSPIKDFCRKQASTNFYGKQGFQNQKITVKLLGNQRNPFVIRYYLDSYYQEKYLYMDYYQQNLEQYLQVNKKSLKIIDVLLILEQIFEAQGFLFSNGIIHGDLKLENFMINQKSGSIKLIDLGSTSEPLYPKNKLSINRNYLFVRQVFCTQSYYRKFQDIDPKLQRKYEIKQNYYKHQNFDMYSIGQMLMMLHQQYIANPNLNMMGKLQIIEKYIRKLIFQLKNDDISSRIIWKQGLIAVNNLKKLIGYQQVEV